MMTIGPGKWTITFEPRPDARLRLLCLHHAGGGAYAYRPWAKLIRPDVELVAVQLPGRENRYGEPALDTAEAVLSGLIAALSDTFDKPYAVFGHSFGAVLAYLMACRLRRTGELPAPARLFLSGARAPRSEAEYDLPLSDKALIARLTRLGGTPQAVLDDPNLIRAFLPTLRADFQILEHATSDKEAPLEIPFTLLRGAADPVVRAEHLVAWRSRSAFPCDQHELPGGHFYLQSAQSDLLAIINDSLAAAQPS